MSNKQFPIPFSSTPGSGGGSGTVTSVTFTGDGTVLSSTPSSAVTTSGTLPATLANASANTVLGNATGSPAAPSYGQIVNGQITNATIDLTAKVTNVLPPANGGIEVINTAGQGYWMLPFGDATLFAGAGSTASVTAGAVRCGMFNLPVSLTFTKMSINVSATSSTNHFYVGIYSANKNTLIVQGTFTLTASTGALGATVSTTTLTPGAYWLAFSADNSTVVVIGGSSSNNTQLNNNNVYWGLAANAESGGIMPSSLGTITSNAATLPYVKLEP